MILAQFEKYKIRNAIEKNRGNRTSIVVDVVQYLEKSRKFKLTEPGLDGYRVWVELDDGNNLFFTYVLKNRKIIEYII